MAYAALASLAHTIDQIFSHDTQYSFSVHYKQQIVAIHEYASFFRAFLENLEELFRQLANEAEDVLENLMWQEIRSRVGVGFEEDPSGEYEQQLRAVAEEIDSIAAEVMEIKNSFINEDARIDSSSYSSYSYSSAAAASSSSSNDVMVGFEEDLLAIKTRLCGGWLKLQVVPIVGMAGIGKTTLARNAYNDPFVVEYFDIRVWVTVSQDYSAKQIMSGLLVQMKDFIKKSKGDDEDEVELYKCLKGRRYLITMDDMWDTEAWNVVRHVFPDDNNGSRIILTTRLSQIAAYADSHISAHEMLFMDAYQSWSLLRQRVFVDQDCPPELEELGKWIAGNCKGLPLAIVVVAGLLSVASKTPTSWHEIAGKVKSGDDVQIDEILSLSYTQLPHRLRPCFLYLGGFREDSEIRVSKLIRMWVAEGFLKCGNEGNKTLEEEAEECLEDLVKRNLVLVGKRKSNGKIKSCNLHDLMRDLCIRKAREEEFIVHLEKKSKIRKYDRRVVVYDASRGASRSIGSSSLHTTIITSSQSDFVVGEEFLEGVRLLRVFDSGCLHIWNLSAILCKNFHIRYLAMHSLSWNNPSYMSNWQSLQTLIIEEGSERWRMLGVHGNYLPQEIWTMQQLRHLVFCGSLPHPKGATSPLLKLQTLSLVSFYSCTETTLKMVPNVKKLGVCCSNGYQGSSTNYLINLGHLHQLQSLTLWSKDRLDLRKDDITIPKTLKKLSLDGILIPWEDFTVVGSLPNLQVLKLREGSWGKGTWTWETNEGEFLQLEFLLIDTPNLMHWITECSHFPKLKSLLLHDCHLLRDIPNDVGEIPTLELIEVKEFSHNNYLGKLAKLIQEEQQELGNYSLEVRLITV